MTYGRAYNACMGGLEGLTPSGWTYIRSDDELI